MNQSNSPRENRNQTLARLGSGATVDVLVVGGGIVGSGIARDAAMRGLSVALVEQNDFASGTSSRSSRLLHGGLRYLAQGRVRLVREASHEKMLIGKLAPHLVTPLPFVLPTFRSNKDWKRWQLRIGVKVYDFLCGDGNYGKSGPLDPEQTAELLPGINPSQLTGSVRYYDAGTQDARLVIDTLRSASNAGASVLNYVRLESAERSGHRWNCGIVDRLNSSVFAVNARSIVNAGGPWGDQLPASGVKLRLSKGVHLVIPREKLPMPEAVVMTDGKRILFVIPWGERIILGTTDTDYAGDLAEPRCEAEDVAYILKITNQNFPGANIQSSDVISTWTGLRPLIADPNGSPSDISREHEIHMPQPGWFDVAGGKLTTYRLMAEQTVDRIVDHLKLSAKPCETARRPLLPRDEVGASSVVPSAVSRDAVVQYCESEWAVHLDDVMIRRSSWQHYHRDAQTIARSVANWMGELLQWSSSHASDEWKRYHAIAQSLVAFKGEPR